MAYLYTELKGSPMPIYISNDHQFLMDALDLGLIVRKIGEHFVACDDYPDAADVMHRFGCLWLEGVQFNHVYHEGALPKTRTFQIPVRERTFGVITVSAANLKMAYKQISPDTLLTKVIPMSLEIDHSRSVMAEADPKPDPELVKD